MRKITVEELQKSLQNLANQKGARGFARAKALFMDGVMVVDADGNPVDPESLDITISAGAPAEVDFETDAMEGYRSGDDDEDKEEMMKSISSEVRSVIRQEMSKSARSARPAVKVESPKVFGRLRAFKSVDEAYRFGRWALACMGSTKSAQWCNDHDILVTKGHTENVNSAGGYLVPDEFENSLITLRDQFGVFRQNARIVPMSSDVKRMPRRQGTVTAYFVGEASAGTQSQQQFDQVNLVAKKLMVLSKISSELNEDNVVSLGDELASEISYAFALKEDQCGFNGDGTSTFGGIVGCTAAIGAGGTADSTDGTLADVDLADCRRAVGKLAQWADTPNAKWYINRTVWNNTFLRLAESATGVMAGEIINETTQEKQFFGYPVVLAQAIPVAANNGDVLAFFGDLSLAAYLGDRRSTTVEFSNAALNAFEQDELVVRGTQRFDINVANVGDATTAGALIKFTI